VSNLREDIYLTLGQFMFASDTRWQVADAVLGIAQLRANDEAKRLYEERNQWRTEAEHRGEGYAELTREVESLGRQLSDARSYIERLEKKLAEVQA
jgi:predicted RNase H-like nuclease (RuvC/YqgF family)